MRSAPPKSASGLLTGFAGVAAGTITLYAIRDWQEAAPLKTLTVIGATALVMIAIDLALYRQTVEDGSNLQSDATGRFNFVRVAQKLIGFWATIAIIAFAYWIFPEYEGDFYAPAKTAALFCLPFMLVISPFYIAYVDMRQSDPDDAYVQMAGLMGGRMPANWDVLANHARGWIVKGFFLPLMFTFLSNDLGNLWNLPVLPEQATFSDYYERLYSLLYLWDVMISSAGYMLTLRALGSQIRSAEPTVVGWVVCLMCYPPFWNMFSSGYLTYDSDQLSWGDFLDGMPFLYTLWGVLIIILTMIYVWATISFGIKFSNLTHRGIITHGPYRWVKHPAYMSKNLSWWMISMPFLSDGDWSLAIRACLMLGLLNCVYYARARTEERHLSRDPTYVEYQTFIREHGLWAHIRSWIGLGAGRRPVAAPDFASTALPQPSHAGLSGPVDGIKAG